MTHSDHCARHDHDLGFAHDLPRMIGRRRALALMAGAGAALSPGLAMAQDVCVGFSTETAGPYPADGSNRKNGSVVNVLTQDGVIREDLRTSFAGMSPVAEGLEMTLDMTLVDATDGCSPLPGRAIYVWHCDVIGQYSLYDETDRNYLRGLGVADAEGRVRLTTIFPGCYDGRWPHVHFEVFDSVEEAVSGRDARLTSQFALPEAECAAVYAADARYANGTRNLGRQDFDRDMVFRDNTDAQKEQQMLRLTGAPGSGYHGEITIGIG